MTELSLPTPAYSTARNPAHRTFGPRAAMISRQVLGVDLMPWQRHVVDIALELHPDRPGEWRYKTVIVTVPRQSGKTALMRAVAVDRMLSYSRHIIMMTAQTGLDASKRWNQITEALEVDKRPKTFKKIASKGSESLTYLRTGSRICPFAPTPKAIHGDSLHLTMIDEDWVWDLISGAALDAAINPTFATVVDSQKWISSTMGTAKSEHLNAQVALGRESVNDPDSDVAYFEWSADPQLAESDPYGRETLAFHPALGHTQSYEKLISLGGPGKEPLATWKRSYLNLVDPAGAGAPIDLAIWDSQANRDATQPAPSSVTIAVDISYDASAAAIYAAWPTPTGVHAACVMSAPGFTWIPEQLTALQNAGFPPPVIDPTGPNTSLLDDLARAGYKATTVTSREYAAACQWVISKVTSGDLTHDGYEETRTALANTIVSPIGGTGAWDAAKSPRPIDTLRALTLAAYKSGTTQTGLQLY